ncbi:MAG: hypothetical protein DRN49_02745 [Thaumarchaeota archaeon]|nr:MAG: hypothetical protein DRN49_02745 [Nitrososphaerota archaeon]
MQEKQFQAIILVEPQVVKASEDEKFIGYFEGIASTPDVDLEGDKFLPEVLAKNAERLKGKPILLLHGKNKEVGDQPIGEILEAKFENGVLKIKAGIYKAFKKIWDAVKRGVLKALSIGGIIKKLRREGNVNIIEDAEIREVSLTPRGMNPFAQVIMAFGKSFVMDDDGFLKEIIIEPEPQDMSETQTQEVKEFEKVDYDLPIVKRESWDGDAAARRIFEWAEKEDGTIDKAKASKLFLVVKGDGKQRGDYSWPVGDIVNGKPVLVSSGIITAIKYAAGARGVQAPPEVKRALERLAKRLVKEGILPEDYEVPWKREKSEEAEIKVKEFEDLKAELMKTIDEKIKEMASNISKQILESLKVEKSEKVKEEKEAEKKEEPKPVPEPKPPEKGVASGEEAIKKTPEPKRITPSQAPSLYQLYAEIYGEDKISD